MSDALTCRVFFAGVGAVYSGGVYGDTSEERELSVSMVEVVMAGTGISSCTDGELVGVKTTGGVGGVPTASPVRIIGGGVDTNGVSDAAGVVVSLAAEVAVLGKLVMLGSVESVSLSNCKSCSELELWVMVVVTM